MTRAETSLLGALRKMWWDSVSNPVGLIPSLTTDHKRLAIGLLIKVNADLHPSPFLISIPFCKIYNLLV